MAAKRRRAASASSAWECGACQLLNEPGAELCACCSSPAAWWRPQSPRREAPAAEAERLSRAMALSLDGAWDCRQCGATNSRDAERCPGCRTLRDRRARQAEVDLAQEGEEEQDWAADADQESIARAIAASLDGAWDCASCGETNPRDAERCLRPSCRAYRDRTAGEAARAEASADAATAGGGEVSRCGLVGCSMLCRPECHGFCSAEHRAKAAARNMLAPTHPGVERVYVGQDGDWTAHLLTKQHERRQAVVDRFLAQWRKPGRPRVQRIFYIKPPPGVYSAFRDQSARHGHVVDRFHGTALAPGCAFGIDLKQALPCGSAECGVCNICREGFRLDRSGSGPGARRMALRFGQGLYFSDTSGKSNDYNDDSGRMRRVGSGRTVEWRCMFLCKVVAGRSHATTEGRIEEPEIEALLAAGCQSVDAQPGGELNYDELVVYDQAQAVPNFLIVYALG